MALSISGKAIRVLITLLGILFILQAAGSLALGVIGERGTAVITHVRREGGERNESTPNRYTYITSYTFTTKDGQVVSDSSRHIGDSVYVKASGKQQIPVRYLKSFPVFNTLEKDAQFSWGKAVLLATGVFLIVVINRPPRKIRFTKALSQVKNKDVSQVTQRQTGEITGGTIGYSAKISDPAFSRYLQDTTRWSFLFASILAVSAVAGFYVYGETSRDMDNPEALYIGLGIGGMFIVIAALQTISRQRDKNWDGVVIDKKIEQKQRRRNSGNNDSYWEKYSVYTVVIRDDDGKTRTISVEDDDTRFNYYQIGDRVRHHKGLNSIEKYDKSKDVIIFCNACASLNDIHDDYCFRCKCPLLK